MDITLFVLVAFLLGCLFHWAVSINMGDKEPKKQSVSERLGKKQ